MSGSKTVQVQRNKLFLFVFDEKSCLIISKTFSSIIGEVFNQVKIDSLNKFMVFSLHLTKERLIMLIKIKNFYRMLVEKKSNPYRNFRIKLVLQKEIFGPFLLNLCPGPTQYRYKENLFLLLYLMRNLA